MIAYALKTAWRSLGNRKGFTMINLAGLVLGLATFMLIGFYVHDELSYDLYNKKADRIFRVNTDLKYGETITSRAIAPPVAALEIIKTFPEVERSVRIIRDGERFKKKDQFVTEDHGAFADADLFAVFTL